MSSAGNRRKGQLVHVKVQRILAIYSVVHWLVFMVVTFGLLFAWQMLTEGPYRPLSEQWSDLWLRYGPAIVILLTLIPVIAYESIKISHRVVGPMLRLRGSMDQLARGETVRPITLRKRDFGQDVVDSFNRVLERVQGANETSDSQK